MFAIHKVILFAFALFVVCTASSVVEDDWASTTVLSQPETESTGIAVNEENSFEAAVRDTSTATEANTVAVEVVAEDANTAQPEAHTRDVRDEVQEIVEVAPEDTVVETYMAYSEDLGAAQCSFTVGGKKINLSKLSNGEAADKLNSYTFHPCKEIAPTGNCPTGMGCSGYQASGDNKCYCLGVVDTQSITQTDEGFKITFTGGSSRSGTKMSYDIMFKCATSESVGFVNESPTYDYHFSWQTPSACPGGGGGGGGSKGGLSGVAIFDIIVFVGIASFIIFGSLFRWKVKGETGANAIPLVGFWKDLPFLCKDGVVFTFGVIKTTFYKITGKTQSI